MPSQTTRQPGCQADTGHQQHRFERLRAAIEVVATQRFQIDRASAEAWWHQAQPFVVGDRCYRLGALADPGALIDGLAAPPSGFLRAELRARTGSPAVWERLVGDPASPGELAGVRAWWATHGARFTPGELHRWGRVVAPSVVD